MGINKGDNNTIWQDTNFKFLILTFEALAKYAKAIRIFLAQSDVSESG